MATVENAHIKAALLDEGGSLGVLLGGVLKLLPGGGLHMDAVGALPVHRADGILTVQIALFIGGSAGVVQLEGGHRAALVDGGRQLIEAGGIDFLQFQMRGRTGGTIAHIDGGVANGDHSRAALGLLGIVGDLVRAGGTGGRRADQHIGGGKDAVAEGRLFNGERCKQVRIGT